MAPREAYTRAGFEPSRANFHRLMKKPKVALRIAELISDRERMIAAARMKPDEILHVLRERAQVVRGLNARRIEQHREIAAHVFPQPTLRDVPLLGRLRRYVELVVHVDLAEGT